MVTSFVTYCRPWITRAKQLQPTERLISFWGTSRTRQAIALVLFFLFFAVTKRGDLLFAAVKLGSMIFQQGTQLVFMKHNQVHERLVFLFPVGMLLTKPIIKQGKSRDELAMFRQGFIYQLGPFINIFLVVVGIVLSGSSIPFVSTVGTYLFLINALTCCMGLAPIGRKDGGMIMDLIFRSSSKWGDRFIALGLTIGAIGFMIRVFTSSLGQNLLILVNTAVDHLGVVAFLIVLIPGIWYKQARDDDDLSKIEGRLTNVQKVIHLTIYLAMIFFSLKLYDGTI